MESSTHLPLVQISPAPLSVQALLLHLKIRPVLRLALGKSWGFYLPVNRMIRVHRKALSVEYELPISEVCLLLKIYLSFCVRNLECRLRWNMV
jgi:hypothetical protein